MICLSHTHARTHARTHTQTHTHTHTHTRRTHPHVHTHTRTHAHTKVAGGGGVGWGGEDYPSLSKAANDDINCACRSSTALSRSPGRPYRLCHRVQLDSYKRRGVPDSHDRARTPHVHHEAQQLMNNPCSEHVHLARMWVRQRCVWLRLFLPPLQIGRALCDCGLVLP